MKFPINDFFSKCNQIRRKLADLVTFTEKIPNGKLHVLCNDTSVHGGKENQKWSRGYSLFC